VTDKGTASSPRAPPTKILDAVQTGLDIAGLVPGVGEIADGTNALIYTLRGDKTNAALSAAACIPFAGWGAAGIKIANKGVKALDKAGDVYDVGRMAGKATSKASSIEGQTVYRVWGGEPSVPELKSSGPWGSSWTPVNPATVSNYRNAAGLPTLGGQSGVANTGRFVSVGRVIDPSGVKIRDAIALDGNTGGLPEYLFLNPPSQIELIGVYGVNPPF
jgi:hypothetical protein